MFHTLATQLWGPEDKADHVVSPGQSTTDDGDDSPIVDLYLVTGSQADEYLMDCTYSFNHAAGELTIRGRDPKQNKLICKVFLGGGVSHFRNHQRDMFQWFVRKSSGTENCGEEFGVLFHNADMAEGFNFEMQKILRKSCVPEISIHGECKEYDRKEREWRKIHDDVTITIMGGRKDFESYLVVHKSDGTPSNKESLINHITISNDEYIFAQQEIHQISWWGSNYGEEGEERRMFAVVLAEKSADAKYTRTQFYETFERKLAEVNGGKRIEDSMDIDEAMGIDEDAFDAGTTLTGKEAGVEFGGSEEDEDAQIHTVVQKDPSREIWTKEPQTMLHMGMEVGSDNTYILRQSKKPASDGANSDIKVLRFDEDGECKEDMNIESNKLSYQQYPINPSKALLHDDESKLLILDKDDKSQVYMMDIEKEQVVQSWEARDMKVQNILPEKKFGKKSGSKKFVAYNPNSLFAMDTRKQGCAVDSKISYATNVQFTAADTDAEGHILLGNKFGDLRLYDGGINAEGNYKRAKTCISGLSDPILHVAATKDGSWILATCQKYLALFPVRLAETKKTGFVSALGKKKPKPIILKMKMEDIAHYNVQDVTFTHAEFDESETTIVTSTNNLVIIWDFLSIKKGGEYKYSIRSADDYVKDVAFVKYGDHENVLLTTPDTVSMKQLRRDFP